MNHFGSEIQTRSARRTLSSLVLGTGFGLTGAGTVMLGVMLPSLARIWGLRDDTSGLLFLLQFLGSSLGAILTGTDYVRSLKMGYVLLVVTSFTLVCAGRELLFAIFFGFGLGLGTVMTSTSLLFSERYEDNRAALLERINFAWSVGALSGTVLFLPFLHRENPRLLFVTFFAVFLSLLIWVLVRERRQDRGGQMEMGVTEVQRAVPWRWLLPLLVLAIGSIGIESSLSGWLTMYSHRSDLQSTMGVTLATSLFWVGMVFSRLAFSTRLLALVGRQRLLRTAIWVAVISVTLIIVAPGLMLIRVAAFLTGFCVGPLYPLLLSFILERSPRGWIFGVAGMGAALFPWLTGLLSEHYGSLRYGLGAPWGAALLMICLLPFCFSSAEVPVLNTPSP